MPEEKIDISALTPKGRRNLLICFIIIICIFYILGWIKIGEAEDRYNSCVNITGREDVNPININGIDSCCYIEKGHIKKTCVGLEEGNIIEEGIIKNEWEI